MALRFGTLSVVVGGKACNASCPFCISRQTPSNGVTPSAQFNLDNLPAACKLADKCGVTTALITGKGEPTIYPEQINEAIVILGEYFPIIELQTNGLLFPQGKLNKWLKIWREKGLKTICLSVVHYLPRKNGEIYCSSQPPILETYYPNLKDTIDFLHDFHYSMRLSVIGCKGYIDSDVELAVMIDVCRTLKVEQLTWRPVKRIDDSENYETAKATERYLIPEKQLKAIEKWICSSKDFIPLMELGFGATVYDVKGQNFCFSTCLTETTKPDEQRQLIYFPDGHLRFSWKYPGAIIF